MLRSTVTESHQETPLQTQIAKNNANSVSTIGQRHTDATHSDPYTCQMGSKTDFGLSAPPSNEHILILLFSNHHHPVSATSDPIEPQRSIFTHHVPVFRSPDLDFNCTPHHNGEKQRVFPGFHDSNGHDGNAAQKQSFGLCG